MLTNSEFVSWQNSYLLEWISIFCYAMMVVSILLIYAGQFRYLMNPNMEFVKFFGKNYDADALAEGVIKETKGNKGV